jgi:hypothetical protein
MNITNQQKHSSNPSIFAISTITTLPNKLKIISLDKEKIKNNIYFLLRVLFFSKENIDCKFICYCETPEEISLILDEKFIKEFPEDFITISDKTWRAIQFSLGSFPWETGGIVMSIATPLGKAGISIFYLTSFNTDYILVDEKDFELTKACIKSNFPIVWADEDSEDITKIDISSININQNNNNNQISVPSNIQPSTFKQLVALPELPLVLTSISINKLVECTRDLIELFFFSERKSRFLSFTIINDEISLIIDENSLSYFPKERLEIIISEPSWIPIKRQQKHGFEMKVRLE